MCLANNPSQMKLQLTADITAALKTNLSLTFKHINYGHNYPVTAGIYTEFCQLSSHISARQVPSKFHSESGHSSAAYKQLMVLLMHRELQKLSLQILKKHLDIILGKQLQETLPEEGGMEQIPPEAPSSLWLHKHSPVFKSAMSKPAITPTAIPNYSRTPLLLRSPRITWRQPGDLLAQQKSCHRVHGISATASGKGLLAWPDLGKCHLRNLNRD